MKSKSFDFAKSPADQPMNKTFDFVGLYRSAAETNVKLAEKRKSGEALHKESPKHEVGTPKRERSPNKNRKRNKREDLEISQIKIDGSSLSAASGRSSPTRVTSTPILSGKSQTQVHKFKSIMKNASVTGEHDEETPNTGTPLTTRSKKRNKSVSFMLEDHEEVVVKKTKSDDSLKVDKTLKNLKDKRKNVKKINHQQSEKENKVSNQRVEVRNTASLEKKTKKMQKLKKALAQSTSESTMNDTDNLTQEKKKKSKKVKKLKSDPSAESIELENNNNEVETQNKIKKIKRKKQQIKPPIDTPEARGEPASRFNEIDDKPDIVEDLENLSIGDNAHTLTNLLDEMTVVDKDKRKKLKQKSKKNKKPKVASSPEHGEEKSEGKEKIKWKRRKWNRDKKGDISEDGPDTSVVVENLPLSIMLNYKKLLSEHFVKYGLIKKIGIAEVYPNQESKPVFTTTINFYSDGAATQALSENNAQFEGARIRVKRALPATQTTIVLRSYAELTDQAISSAFLGAGKIRSIRHLVKGKKTIGTAFVEFDGPDSVERAIKMSVNAKIGGKKIHVAKFEVRAKKEKKHKQKGDGDSAVDADSEDSND